MTNVLARFLHWGRITPASVVFLFTPLEEDAPLACGGGGGGGGRGGTRCVKSRTSGVDEEAELPSCTMVLDVPVLCRLCAAPSHNLLFNVARTQQAFRR